MNRQTIAAIVLGIIALVVVVRAVLPSGTRRPPPPPPPPAATAAAAAALQSLTAQSADAEPETYASEYARLIAGIEFLTMLDFEDPAVRNPFRPLVGPGSLVQEEEILTAARGMAGGIIDDPDFATAEELNLGYSVQGIVWSAGGPLALVNEQVLGVGEEIEEGGIITAITGDSVVFTYEGQSVTLFVDTES